MSFLVSLAVLGGAAIGAHAECVSIAAAAQDAGVSSLLSAVDNAAASEPALATLRDLINRSTEVDEADQVTLFMPTEAAFGEVSGVMATLDTETVSDLVLNHVVDEVLDSAAVTSMAQSEDVEESQLETEFYTELKLTRDTAGDIFLTPLGTEIMSKVTTSDIKTCAGIIHLVDAVLVPAVEADDEDADAVAADEDDDDEDDESLVEVLGEQSGEIDVVGRALLQGRSRSYSYRWGSRRGEGKRRVKQSKRSRQQKSKKLRRRLAKLRKKAKKAKAKAKKSLKRARQLRNKAKKNQKSRRATAQKKRFQRRRNKAKKVAAAKAKKRARNIRKKNKNKTSKPRGMGGTDNGKYGN